MKLARCLQLAGLLVVVEGTREYSLGAGRFFFAPSGCPAEWTKLSLRASIGDVKQFARDKGVEMIDLEAEPTNDPAESVHTYGSDDDGFYGESKKSAMYFNILQKEMMLSTTDVLSTDMLMNRVVKSKGQFVLQDGMAIAMLEHLAGWTVCIDDEDVMKKFEAENKNKTDWAKKFKAFVMRDKTLRIWQDEKCRTDVTAEEAINGAIYKKDEKLNVWVGPTYTNRENRYVISAIGCNMGPNLILPINPLFHFSYEGDMDATKFREIVKIISEIKAKKAFSGPLVL
eukprot:GHVS01089736.1.p1 GENE.GHVS01089736.1~~GHVS01089736.1.p1  ORF type:complete len:285 (+),score=33.67 GHVS01089736.1:36-890(+)